MMSALDDTIPLQGASHADVVEYRVETPLRYAECFALLADGRKVSLQEPRKFVGWSGHDANRSLLFCCNGKHFEVPEAEPQHRSSLARKFIGVDGDLVNLPT